MGLPTSLPVFTLQPEVVGAELFKLKTGPLGLWTITGLPSLPSFPGARLLEEGVVRGLRWAHWEPSDSRGSPVGALEAVPQG